MHYMIQYIRDEKKTPIGCVAVVVHEDNSITFGISLHNPKDKWNRDMARKIAFGRAYKDGILPDVPNKKKKYVNDALNRLMRRVEKFYNVKFPTRVSV